MAIPRIIHLCWFGNGKATTKIERCLKTVHRLEPRYEIRTWNESNYDVTKSPLVADAYNRKRWSLVSNYVRLDVLKRHGGIYLDTDVEVVKPFDDLLDREFFIGFMWDCNLGTAVIGAVPEHPVVNGVLWTYDNVAGSYRSPNNDTFTEYFLEHVPGFRLNGKAQRLNDGVEVFDKYAFEQPSWLKRRNYSIHHFEQSWKSPSKIKAVAKRAVVQYGSLWLYRKYICYKSLRISPFYQTYAQELARGR
jgi:mannosyltransferase OCH1-like enzyme